MLRYVRNGDFHAIKIIDFSEFMSSSEMLAETIFKEWGFTRDVQPLMLASMIDKSRKKHRKEYVQEDYAQHPTALKAREVYLQLLDLA